MSKIFISFSFIFILSVVNAQTYTPTPENLAARKDLIYLPALLPLMKNIK